MPVYVRFHVRACATRKWKIVHDFHRIKRGRFDDNICTFKYLPAYYIANVWRGTENASLAHAKLGNHTRMLARIHITCQTLSRASRNAIESPANSHKQTPMYNLLCAEISANKHINRRIQKNGRVKHDFSVSKFNFMFPLKS